MAEFIGWCIFLSVVFKYVIPLGIAANLAKKGFGRDELDEGEEPSPEIYQAFADMWHRIGRSTDEEYRDYSRKYGTKFK